jgi:sulfur-oxidizing protein SoxA
MLGITAYVASASRGLPMDVHIDERSMNHFLQGRSLYYKRMGQINLACTHCHEQNWGSKLQGETISQGHVNNYPVYRLEWQRMGSLHRRIRACLSGVRAYMFELGSEQMLDLELFLSWRSSDPKILIESPGVRR